MNMPSINIQIIITLNSMHKGKTMSVQPVEISKAYRLLQVGSTTMISAKYDGVENVMSAAWVGLAGERKVVAYIGTQAFTRQLVEKSGYFVVQIPVVSQMATVLYAGGRSYADAPDKNDTIPFFYQPEFDLPLVAGCAGWLVCKVMPYPDIQQQHNLFMGDDDRTYRAALEQAQAALARAKTQASLAQSEANRTDKLVHTNLVSREEWEQRRSAAVQAQADIRAAQAAVDAAQLNLDFTKVTAPIDGRASRALITSGNLVTAGDTASVLTTLVSQKTVYVYFDVDESTYLHYQNLARRGQGASSDNQALPVEIGLVGEEGYPHQGKVDFLDNQLTPSTGTIRMRALLDNSQRLFTPGLFARVRLPGSAEFKATLIDDKAVLTDQDRKYVYIVDKDGKAQRRDITPGRLADGLRIVQKGLNPGDSVIVDGLQKVFMPGMPVNAKTVAMTSSATLN